MFVRRTEVAKAKKELFALSDCSNIKTDHKLKVINIARYNILSGTSCLNKTTKENNFLRQIVFFKIIGDAFQTDYVCSLSSHFKYR